MINKVQLPFLCKNRELHINFTPLIQLSFSRRHKDWLLQNNKHKGLPRVGQNGIWREKCKSTEVSQWIFSNLNSNDISQSIRKDKQTKRQFT
jgi:hypothetical protein